MPDYMKGVPAEQRPDAKLIGSDGNIFALMGRATGALRSARLRDAILPMQQRVTAAKSYDEALAILAEYVNP